MSDDPSVLMWEVRIAYGRQDELLAYVREHADASAQIFVAEDPARLVVIDPSGQGLPDAPAELVARPAHEWTFRIVER